MKYLWLGPKRTFAPFITISLGTLLILLNFGAPPPFLRGESGDESLPSLATIQRSMENARGLKNYARLGVLASQAAQIGTPDAYLAMIRWALEGENRELELRVFRILKDVTDPEALAVIYRQANKNPNFKTRIILLGVAYQHVPERSAFQTLANGLLDRSRPVALTAVMWLRKSKNMGYAVPPLIHALERVQKIEKGRLLHDIQNALRELTGTKANLEVAADWRNYWETLKAGGTPKTSNNLTQVVSAKFFSIPIQSSRLLFMIDISGSMEKKDPPLPRSVARNRVTGKTVVRKTTGKAAEKKKTPEELQKELPITRQRLYRVKQELIRTIQSLPSHTYFTVLSFNSNIRFVDDSPRLLAATQQNKTKAIHWVNSMKAESETWSDTAFEEGLARVAGVDTIYFLSDGQPYRDGKHLGLRNVADSVKTLNRFVKSRVHTIGFRQAGDNLQNFLKVLALENDGTYTALE